MGLQLIAGTANWATKATIMIGGLATAAMAFDTYNFVNGNTMSVINSYNGCKTPFPLLSNLIYILYLEFDGKCNLDANVHFQKQFSLLPVVAIGSVLGILALRKIESTASDWNKKLNA